MRRADKIGIDVPLAWPRAFVDSLTAYENGSAWTTPHSDVALRLRATDRFVTKSIGRTPLSVSTDKIAMPAMRAARLLSHFDPQMDRSGAGKVVEVYPAASLTVWGFKANQYKGRVGAKVRAHLIDSFRKETEKWVTLSETCYAACIADDNAFDALVASLTARAAQRGLCHAIPEEDLRLARVEGWIALPTPGSLGSLA